MTTKQNPAKNTDEFVAKYGGIVRDGHRLVVVAPTMPCPACGWDVEGSGHAPTCTEQTEPLCPLCGRDYEGCECEESS
jgi:hypothetical protein